MANWFNPSNRTPQEQIDLRRSWVRVVVTYCAMGFVFLVSPVLMGVLIYKGENDKALTLFNTILPVATGVISFWFATRSVAQQPQTTEQDKDKNDREKSNDNSGTHNPPPSSQGT